MFQDMYVVTNIVKETGKRKKLLSLNWVPHFFFASGLPGCAFARRIVEAVLSLNSSLRFCLLSCFCKNEQKRAKASKQAGSISQNAPKIDPKRPNNPEKPFMVFLQICKSFSSNFENFQKLETLKIVLPSRREFRKVQNHP